MEYVTIFGNLFWHVLTFLQATGTYKREASRTSFTIWDQTHAFGVFHEVNMSHFIRGGRSDLLVASPSNPGFFFIQLLVYNHFPPSSVGKGAPGE